MNSYRNAFISTLIIAVLLAVALAFVGWRFVLRRGPSAPETAVTNTAMPGTSHEHGEEPPSQPREPQLVPVQLTPQRMQSIGITSKELEVKDLSNEIRAAGNVA